MGATGIILVMGATGILPVPPPLHWRDASGTLCAGTGETASGTLCILSRPLLDTGRKRPR